MTCFAPMRGWYGKAVNPETGKRPIVFNVNLRDTSFGEGFDIPCGKCIGCQLERSRDWTLRCLHEQKMHVASCFLTLTYEDKYLPARCSLVKRDLQLFMKLLRKRRAPGLRYFAAGEYGETTGRPHYHVLLFNTDFPDRVKRTWADPSKPAEYVSNELSEVWWQGSHLIGDVTARSCAYVAGYCLKKVSKARLDGREPEFTAKSIGLGKSWFEKYHGEAYAADSAIVDGREVPLCNYYDDEYEKLYPAANGKLLSRLDHVKLRRQARVSPEDSTQRRLRVREDLARRLREMNRKGEL